MKRLLLSLSLLCCCMNLAEAKSNFYQIDLVAFVQQNPGMKNTIAMSAEQFPTLAQGISLQKASTKARKPYTLLSSEASGLEKEAWTLRHKPQYKVLFQYSWLQPLKNSKTVSIKAPNREGWDIQGTIKVSRSNYYLLDANMLFLAADMSHPSFLLKQKQRLKAGQVYYLDDAKIGMLIKIHQVA